MTDSMIERVSLAMYEHLSEKSYDTTNELVDALSRAAIAAMREPTAEMNNAYGTDLEQSYQYWTRMIDAALKE